MHLPELHLTNFSYGSLKRFRYRVSTNGKVRNCRRLLPDQPCSLSPLRAHLQERQGDVGIRGIKFKRSRGEEETEIRRLESVQVF